jgi:O-antigen ligase
MIAQRVLWKYIKRPFLDLKGNRIIGLFWNSMIVGFGMLPIGIGTSTPFFIIAMFLGLVYLFKTNNGINLKDLVFLSYPMLFFTLLISLSYTQNIDTGLKQLERLFPLLFFPILFLFIKENESIVRKIFYALLAGIIISFFINLYQAFSISISVVENEIVFDPSISGGYSFMESFNHGGSHFVGANFSKKVHPSYIALYILTVLVFFYNRMGKQNKIVVYPLLLIYLFFLASRASFVILIILFILHIFDVPGIKAKIKRAILLVVLGVCFLGINPRVHTFFNRMLDFTEKKNYNYTTSEQSRILIYKTCLKLIKDAPFFGYGIGDADDKLLFEYDNANYLKNKELKLNAHNQYFQTLLQVGLVGLFFLVSPLIIVLYRKKNRYMLAMIVVFGGTLLFESMLVRYNGIVFFSIMIPFLLRSENDFRV